MIQELANARRTIDKAEEALKNALDYFGHQAAMNAASHLSAKVMYPPIHSQIESALYGIAMFRDSYPEQEQP
jgi:hypothetical protein